ncbi:MAG: ATPase domain-containing protein [Candidatus Odinarchaeia archaeon]
MVVNERLIVKRVKTGVPGLDGILHGGFIKGSNVLVTGEAGTGKTILCMQFLHAGAVKYNEPGIFITLEELPDEIRREALQFGWDFESLEKENKFALIDAASAKAGLPTDEKYAVRRGFTINDLAEQIYNAATAINAQRIAIDSISGLELREDDLSAIRTAIFKLSTLLRELKVTSIITSEMIEGASYTRYKVEEFIAQGLIILYLNEEEGELKRSLLVRKMRSTAHSLRRYPFEITSKGIVVLPEESL